MKGEVDELPQGTPAFSPSESLNSFNMFKLVEEESTRQLLRLTKERDTLRDRQEKIRLEMQKYERLLGILRS